MSVISGDTDYPLSFDSYTSSLTSLHFHVHAEDTSLRCLYFPFISYPIMFVIHTPLYQ